MPWFHHAPHESLRRQDGAPAAAAGAAAVAADCLTIVEGDTGALTLAGIDEDAAARRAGRRRRARRGRAGAELAAGDPPPAAGRPAHNLPAQTTRLVGRQEELTSLRTVLDAARLVTLTGPGGSGKTHLALELAAAILPRFADGVFLVRLTAQLYAKALAFQRPLDNRAGMAVVLFNLGLANLSQGEDARARACLEEAQLLYAELGSERWVARIKPYLAVALTRAASGCAAGLRRLDRPRRRPSPSVADGFSPTAGRAGGLRRP
jgi:hypothetical protein